MLFNSWQYAVFLPLVFILYWALPHKYRWVLILISSYYFYASWNVKYLLLIIFITIVSFFGGKAISACGGNTARKKLAVAVVAGVSLSVLFVFKYLEFAVETVRHVFACFSVTIPEFTSSLLLPVGISFYTFQAIGYIVDVYRGDIVPETHLGKYAAFISFFPQLVAGPIERTRNLLPQLKERRIFDYGQATYGLKLMAWGYFKKIVIADTLAVYVDFVYRDMHNSWGFSRLTAIIFFAIQIYCDFSGYSDIARGTAKLLGIELMENFKSPYFATSIKEFWRRWHISLSSWFRDYIYIPLGGNRCGKIRNAFNLMVTFFASGAWHGAAWTFIAWGGGHGALQVIENQLKDTKAADKIKIPRPVKMLVTFILVCGLWTVFRAESVHDAAYMCLLCFVGFDNPASWLMGGIGNLGLTSRAIIRIILMLIILGTFDYYSQKTDVILAISKKPLLLRWTVYLLLVVLIFVWAPAESAEFIYFDF
ncbi:MAG: MBOAT family protein [Butyrivibrio sp.]|nr:MBOAT family protein [Butyrivibrio sp.]